MMELTFTEAAVSALSERHAVNQLSLFYDAGTEVCACANSGVFRLIANDNNDPYDTIIDTNLGQVKAQSWAMIYLDAHNVIDYSSDRHSFVLKSERGFLNLNLSLKVLPNETVASK